MDRLKSTINLFNRLGQKLIYTPNNSKSGRTTCGDPVFCGKCKDVDCPEYPK